MEMFVQPGVWLFNFAVFSNCKDVRGRTSPVASGSLINLIFIFWGLVIVLSNPVVAAVLAVAFPF